jgi:hypothetical protein
MPFITIPGLTGKIYVPETDPATPRKHPCRDCFSCQSCTNDRCQICLKRKSNSSQGRCMHKKTDEAHADI